MARVTAITAAKRGTDEMTIKVDGRSTARLGAIAVNELGLRVGLEWDNQLAARVEEAAKFDKALRTAMSKLNRRAMTRRRLDAKLRTLRVDASVRQRILDRLTELIQQSTTSGPGLLRQKLRRMGLDAELTERLLDESIDAQVQLERATALAHQRLERMAGLDAATRRRRLYGLLARRGVHHDTINQVFQAVEGDVLA